MENVLSVLLISLSLFLLSSELEAVPTPKPLYCRGPLTYNTTPLSGTVAFFKRNDREAGLQGAFLEEGTCAWSDRPMTYSEPSNGQLRQANEPLILSFGDYKRFGGKNATGYALNRVVPAFINCNHDQRCVFMLKVIKSNNKLTQQSNGVISIYFPSFVGKRLAPPPKKTYNRMQKRR